MTDLSYNLLTQPLIQVTPGGPMTLPGLLAALSRDDVECFPALRPHQGPAWHMFLVQLGALALHKAGVTHIPETEEAWRGLLRGLTSDFVADEPWSLVVDDWERPAFMQAPVPKEVNLKKKEENCLFSPDTLDLLMTAENHDLKQRVARQGEAQDWIFALISLQTGAGFGGRENYGIARMKGSGYSRPMLSLAPLPRKMGKSMTPRLGAQLCRDISTLLATREHELGNCVVLYSLSGGSALIWLEPWEEGAQLSLQQLDIWFIEVCRRVRLQNQDGVIVCWRGNSKTSRINSETHNGVIGDPWAPIHKTNNACFSLSKYYSNLDYSLITRLLLGEKDKEGNDVQNWDLPLLARIFASGDKDKTMALVAEVWARYPGNSAVDIKTEGFRSRILPLGGKVVRALSIGPKREELHKLAQQQIEEISKFDKAIVGALVLMAAGGDPGKRKKEHYARATPTQKLFYRAADELFFPHLWARFEAQEKGPDALKAEKELFARTLYERARNIFEISLRTIPCASIFRPRAEVRADRAFTRSLRKPFPELFPQSLSEEADDDAA